MARRPEVDIRHKLGWKPDPLDHRDITYKLPRGIGPLPASVDLREGQPPIWDQGDLGSCTANATGAQCWFLDKTAPYEPSRLFIYYNTRVLEGTVREDSGASIRNSIKSVVKYGFCSEADWVYDTTKFTKKPSTLAYKNAKLERIVSYARVPQTERALKTALYQGLPVNFGFAVYSSFESDEVGKTGMVAMPLKKEALLGGHATLLVGYNDAMRRYIGRNSWSDAWGDKGYFYIPYDYVHSSKLSDDFWIIKAVP